MQCPSTKERKPYLADLPCQIFGYEDPQTLLGWNLSTERQQLISSLMTLGAFISSSFAGPIARFAGRRGCIWSAAVLCAIANIIMMASTNIGALYVGRFVIGLANGMFMTFSQLYIQVSREDLSAPDTSID